MLADAGSTVRPNRKNAPEPEQDPPRAYSDDELRKLFAVMDKEEQVIFKFFLGTGCREQEVQHAEWSDIDWQHHTHTVRAKPKWGSSRFRRCSYEHGYIVQGLQNGSLPPRSAL